MVLDYTPFIDRVIHRYEGGYGWNHKDPGGPTKYGITCYDLAEHRGLKMTSMDKWAPIVRDMPLADAEAIYRVKYAGAIRFDDLPPGIDCVMLDYGINSGCARPLRVARTLLGLPAGGLDQPLLDAIKKCNPRLFVQHMNQERLRFMHAIRGGTAWSEFGHGWGARVADLDTYCLHLVDGTAGQITAVDLTQVVTPKAVNVAKTAPKTTVGGAVAAGGTLVASGYHWAATAATVAGVFGLGLGYEIWQERKANAANNRVHV